MGRARLLLVMALALPLALGAAMMARGMVAGKPKTVTVIAAPEKPTAQVLVARHDLAMGDRITPDMLEWKAWPIDGLSPTYISKGAPPAPPADPKAKLAEEAVNKAGDVKTALLGDAAKEAITGSVVRAPFLAGEPINTAKLVKSADGGVMAVALTPGMRAMSVPLSPETGAGGFIQPGDHVDVVQTRKMDIAEQGAQWVANTVMKNVKVIAVDASTKADSKIATTQGMTATLEVSPDQAEAIVLARVQGELTLVLRSYADASGPTVEGQMHRAEAITPPVVRVFRACAPAEDVRVAR
ncbi:Flp pilus assembly protein CpaB [soil metagenome]